jgi:hypothetical protein
MARRPAARRECRASAHGETARPPGPARQHGRTAAQGHGRAAAARRDGSRRLTAKAHGETAARRRPVAARGTCAARRPHGEMAARPLPARRPHGEAAAGPGARDAWRGGRTARRPNGNERSGCSSIRGRSLAKFARRDIRAAAARQLGETPRQDICASKRPCGEGRDCRTSKRPRGETAAWRLHSESECLVSRAVAARRDGRTARWPRGRCLRGPVAGFRDRGEFGRCRTEDRGVGAVGGIEQTFRALRNRLLGLRLRSCLGKKILVITKYYNVQIVCQRCARGARHTDLTWRILFVLQSMESSP